MLRMLTVLSAFLLVNVAAAQEEDGATASASFINAEGEASGTAELQQVASGGVLIQLEVTGLPADGWVAFHVHETGSCDAASGHDSAGGHFNPGGQEHGYMAPGGSHAGDMPNQYVPADGTLRAEVFNAAVTLAEGDNSINGRALMIHASEDDYVSQPSGDAGARLACAVIE